MKSIIMHYNAFELSKNVLKKTINDAYFRCVTLEPCMGSTPKGKDPHGPIGKA